MVLDTIIVIFLLFGALIGFKQGFTKSLVSMLGSVAVLVLAFILKEPVGNFLATVMPFIDFDGLDVLNVMFYQMVALIILVIVFGLIVKFLLCATTIFEKILNATIVLGVASKLLGAIVGFVKYYIITFIILFILSFPFFENITILKDSKLKSFILENSLILSKTAEATTELTKEIKDIANDEKNNEEIIKLLIEYDLISEESINRLIEKGKIKE